MNRFVSALCIVLLVAATCFAQCPGGNCPSQPQNPGMSAPPASGINYGPVEQKGHLLSVVRVVCPLNDSSMNLGSGVYVIYEGLPVVLTANHVVRGARSIRVRFPGGRVVVATVAKIDADYDYVVLLLESVPEDAVASEVAYGDEADQLRGTMLHSVGYGPDDVLRAGYGQFQKFNTPRDGLPADWITLHTVAKQGDSGGPIFNASGRVVGILWGSDFESTVIGTGAGRLHILLTETCDEYKSLTNRTPSKRPPAAQPKGPGLDPPVLPWRDKIEDEIDGLKRRPQQEPRDRTPSKPKPKEPVAPPPPIEIEIDPPMIEPRVVDDTWKKVLAVGIAISVVIGLLGGVAVQWNKKHYS